MKNQKVDNRITKEEFRELHSKRQSKTLTPYEKYKIRCKLKNLMQENILIHLYTKFLYFGMKEFNQRKFDIKIEVGTCTDDTITNHLKALQKMGYITQEFKQVKGKNYNRTHFNINIEKMNEFLTIGDDLKPENFSRLIETLRRQNEVVKPNPFDTTKKKNTPKSNTDNKPKTVETTDNKMNETLSNEHTPIKPAVKPIEELKPIVERDDDEMIDNDVKEVIRPVKEPIKEFKPIVECGDDDEMIGIGFKELKPAVEPIILKRPEKGENVRRAIQKELTKQKEQEKKPNPIEEPIKQIEEPTEPIDKEIKEINEHTPINPIVKPIEEIKTAEEPINEIEIINNKNDAIMRETNTDDDDNIELNEKARLILKYKDNEGVKPVLKDLMLSTETINDLCSEDYKIGLDEKLDDKKETLDILFDVFIKGIIKKENE